MIKAMRSAAGKRNQCPGAILTHLLVKDLEPNNASFGSVKELLQNYRSRMKYWKGPHFSSLRSLDVDHFQVICQNWKRENNKKLAAPHTLRPWRTPGVEVLHVVARHHNFTVLDAHAMIETHLSWQISPTWMKSSYMNGKTWWLCPDPLVNARMKFCLTATIFHSTGDDTHYLQRRGRMWCWSGYNGITN